MRNTKRWIISAIIGIAVEGILFALCWLTSHDLLNNGPDTKLSICFAYASLWGGWILKVFADRLSDASVLVSILAFALYFVLPAIVYSLITYFLLRPNNATQPDPVGKSQP